MPLAFAWYCKPHYHPVRHRGVTTVAMAVKSKCDEREFGKIVRRKRVKTT